MWKRKIRDLLDNHERSLEVTDGKLVKPTSFPQRATVDEIKEQKEKSYLIERQVVTQSL